MPLSRISLRKGKSPAYKQAILDGIYLAMRETFDVPEDDRFMIVSEHEAEDFNYDANYLGIARSDDLVIIQLTVSNTRPLAKKQALYRRIVERLSDKPGPAAGRHLHQSRRGAAGELVVRSRPRAICEAGGGVSYRGLSFSHASTSGPFRSGGNTG